MKRKQLERMEPEQMPEGLTGEFVVAAVLRETDESSILELDIWGAEDAFRVRPMICRHFLDKHMKEYETLFMSTQEFERKTYHAGDWTKLGIGSILSRGRYCWNYYPYSDDEKVVGLAGTQRIIKEYTEGEKWRSAINSVDAIESEIRNERMEKTYQRRINRVNDAMRKIKPVVNDEFCEWLNEVVFPEKYIFAETRKLKTGYRMKCCACGKTSILKEKPKHNEEIMCGKCGVKAVIKTRVQQVSKKKNVLVVQKYSEDTWVLRHFKFKKTYGTVCGVTKERLEELEKVRMILPAGKIYYGQDNQYGADEWKQDWWDAKCNNGMVIDRNFFLYPKGITEAPMEIELKRMLLAGAVQGAELNYNNLVRNFTRYPYMEYLIKGRYYKLADELLMMYWMTIDEFLDVNADNIPDLLKLEPQRAYRLRDMNGGRYALNLLQLEERDGIKISQENLEFADGNNLNENRLLIHRTQMGINKALNYIRRQMKRNHMSLTTILQYYKDYLDMAEERGADITDDIIRVNARMVEFHMAYLEEKNRKRDEGYAKRMEDKYPNIRKDYERNKMLFNWENEQYVILTPRDIKDIVDEGRSQHHCVAASETYFNKMNQRASYILFLRKKGQEQIPWYTLEVAFHGEKIKVMQKYAAYDRQPDIGTVNKILKQWKSEVEKRNKGDMRKAG